MDRKTALLLENHFFCGITAMGYRCGRYWSLISFLFHHYIGLHMGVLPLLEFRLRNNSLGHSGDKASAGNVEMEGALAIVYHSIRLRVPIVARLQGDGLPLLPLLFRGRVAVRTQGSWPKHISKCRR
jgi:hypothetical protein